MLKKIFKDVLPIGIEKFNVACLNATLQVKKAIIMTYLESLVIMPVLLFLVPKLLAIEGVWITLAMTAAMMLVIYFTNERKRR